MDHTNQRNKDISSLDLDGFFGSIADSLERATVESRAVLLLGKLDSSNSHADQAHRRVPWCSSFLVLLGDQLPI